MRGPRGQANVWRVTRAVLGAAAIAVAAVLAGSAAGGAHPVKGSVRIAFAGDGRQALVDYKQWIFQTDGNCYYDRDVRQTATFSWSTTFPALSLARLARASGRALSGVQTTASGAVAGPEVRGDCGSDDVPPGWVQTISCDQPLQFSGPGSLELRRSKPGTALLVLRAPPPDLASPTVCSLLTRGKELVASVKLDLSRLTKLARGKSTSVRVGTTSEINCSTHPAPYEGTEVTDECHDTLAWHGTVTITKS